MTERATDWTQIRSCPCGWQSKASTAGLADAALRKHRCDKYRAGVERVQRVIARKAASGPKRGCAHKIANHAHGTRAAYVRDRCRCRPCRDATAVVQRQVNREVAYGRWQPYIDATEARNHVHWLMLNNVGLKRIVKISGVSQGCLWKLMYGKRRHDGSKIPSRRIRQETADRLLAVQPTLDALADGALVDATGTRRRLQALVANGHSMSRLGAEIGWTPGNFCPLVSDAEVVRASTARAVRDLYDRLWDVPPPNSAHREKISVSRARRYAATRGWLPPLAWDDESIDDPSAAPEVVSLTRSERRAAQDEDAAWLREQGCSEDEIARRVGLSVDGMAKRRERAAA